MKLSISNIAWNESIDSDIFEHMKALQYQGLEIAPTRIVKEEPYKNILKATEFTRDLNEKFGISISSIQSIWFGKSELLFRTETEYQHLMEYTKDAIKYASALKCGNVVFGCPKNRVIQSKNDYSRAIGFFEEIGDFAVRYNTCISIEPNPEIYGTNFINTTDEAFQLVRQIKSEGIKVNLDFGTMIFNQEEVASIEKHVHLINHVHISEPYLLMIEKRQAHKELAKLLREYGYDKYVSIEMKNLNSDEYVKQAMLYVREVFS